MCRRWGSKGGCDFADTPQNFTSEHTAWETLCHQIQAIDKAVEQTPTALFLMEKWGKSESHSGKRKSRGNLPLRKDKDIIDLLRCQMIPGSDKTNILQREFSPTIPDGGKVRYRHTNGRSQVLALVSMVTHNLIKQFFIHETIPPKSKWFLIFSNSSF